MIIASAVDSKYGMASQGNVTAGFPADFSDVTFPSSTPDPTDINPLCSLVCPASWDTKENTVYSSEL
jgi:hypothetical protein